MLKNTTSYLFLVLFLFPLSSLSVADSAQNIDRLHLVTAIDFLALGLEPSNLTEQQTLIKRPLFHQTLYYRYRDTGSKKIDTFWLRTGRLSTPSRQYKKLLKQLIKNNKGYTLVRSNQTFSFGDKSDFFFIQGPGGANIGNIFIMRSDRTVYAVLLRGINLSNYSVATNILENKLYLLK